MTFLIRSALPIDSDSICEVYLSSRKQFLPYAPIPHTDEEVRRWMSETLIPDTDVYVAVRREVIVGMMVLLQRKAASWIDQLYLHPDAVGQGIGTRLLKQAMMTLKPPIRLYTFQENNGARRFYERHGFQAIKFGDGSQNEENCPDVLYEWCP